MILADVFSRCLFFVSGGGVVKQTNKGDPGDRGTNPLTGITFSCAVVNIPAMYNLQHHQRPVALIPCLYSVGG